MDLLRSAVDFDLDPIVEVVERRVAIDRKPLAGGLGLGAVQHRNLDIRIVLVLPGQVVPRRCKVLREKKYRFISGFLIMAYSWAILLR